VPTGRIRMNWEAIGAIGEIIGALGVIASLFYVAYQVKQNTNQGKLNTIAVESASSEALNAATNASRTLLASDPEVAELFIRGAKDPTSLSEVELLQYRQFMASGVSNSQLVYESYQRGVSQHWIGIRNVLARMLDSPGGQWFWENYKNDYTIEFQEEIGSILSGDKASESET